MLNNRQGQAKILSLAEIKTLLEIGFICARDQALFMFCFYTACRVSEARQMPIGNVFYKGSVLDEIVIPKEITKGKQGTRTVPTHPSLAKFLKKYYQDSLELLELKKAIGGWSPLSVSTEGKIKVNQYWKCPRCSSTWVFKSGTDRGVQRYCCRACSKLFRESTAIKNEAPSETIEYSLNTLGVSASNNYAFLFADPNNPFLFPGKRGKGCLGLDTATYIFETAFERVGIVGASSHSCRRTALTTMHSAGVPLRVLQEISGHKDLGALQRYLEVTEEEIAEAVNVLG